MTYLKSAQKEDCCGCKACAEICPKKCISMNTDPEGFYYPQIDKSACIDCGLCQKVCPQDYLRFISKENISAYIVLNSEEVILKSASGGAFTAICQATCSEGYIVYGAKFDKSLNVCHDFADTQKGCEMFRKSKYVQSDLEGCYSSMLLQLISGKKVLFSGTPCQCAAVQGFLDAKKIDKSKLLVVSLFCRGVPNQEIFNSYIKELNQKNGGNVTRYTFKNKTETVNGKMNSRTACIEFENGDKKIVDLHTDPYLKGYYNRLFLRPSCGKCLFARPDRVSDITLADAWGINKIYSDLDPLKGVSLVLTHSEKGEKIFNKIDNSEITIEPLDSKWAIQSQSIMHKPVWMNANREKFFELIGEGEPFSDAVEKALKPPSITNRCVIKTRNLLLYMKNKLSDKIKKK